MANWKYRLRTGKCLRQAIDMEDYEKVVANLKECYQELYRTVPDGMFDGDDLEEAFEELDYIEGTVWSFYNEDDMVEEDEVLSEIDYHLGEFYTLCDNLGVWVEV